MGICISVPEKDDDDENVTIFEERKKVLNGSQRLFSVYSKQGTKGLNQDAASIHQGYGTEDGTFCGVYDGHGGNGHRVSKIVSSQLSSLILEQKNVLEKIDAIENGCHNTTPKNHVGTMKENSDANNFQKWKEAIVSAFKVMEKEVKLQHNLDCSGSGTTAVVIIKQGEGLVIANLGDSRAVMGTICEEKLVATQLTTDLKPELPREAERIRRCNGCVYASKEEPEIQRVWMPNNEHSPGLAMSRSFGDFLLKDYGVIAIPDISHHPLASSDQFIVLASDGVWDVLSNDEVASIVWSAESEEVAARAVVEAATAAWKNKFPSYMADDCTVVCLFLHQKPQLQPFKN
ncbi:probable protein phosphatase 2C 72 isoform X2 [Vigna radiata var. radiata]|uniref:Probable protein phosphatase 2C 72 isoform X2 n=1 Tax=Vigna radiata var. radiata TaxID=3916 RepID=A0A1S3UHC8_VIGRR|nr:probable protein phosphatase 2C 72 isoform X2 [Vigna radiata var. radiata]